MTGAVPEAGPPVAFCSYQFSRWPDKAVADRAFDASFRQSSSGFTTGLTGAGLIVCEITNGGLRQFSTVCVTATVNVPGDVVAEEGD